MMPSQICAASIATFSLMNACWVPVYMSRNARSRRLPSRIDVVPAARCAHSAHRAGDVGGVDGGRRACRPAASGVNVVARRRRPPRRW